MSAYPTYEIEEDIKSEGYSYVVGVDEAGRGPGAGPVVAGAVHVPDDVIPELLFSVNDSKKLTPKNREKLFDMIKEKCDIGIGIVSNEVIDDINILCATKLAMEEAIRSLNHTDYVIVDGTVVLNGLSFPQRQVIKGDTKSISIAAGSIVAKVIHDRIMRSLHDIWPIYSWDKNMGYLTKDHIAALQEYGPCEFHRMTFRKVGK